MESLEVSSSSSKELKKMTDISVKWPAVVLDLVTLGTVGMVMVLIEKTGTPFRRGFFCSDESIRYPIVFQTKFNSKTLAAMCLSISFTTVLVKYNSINVYIKQSILPVLRGITLLIFFTSVTPMRRGFYCDDETIRYPFKDSTIPNWLLYIYGFSIPFSVITITEFITHRSSRASGTFLTRPIPVWFIYMYRSLVDFLFGCAASQLVTDIGKYTIGRLRPNFLAVCEPDINLNNCSIYGHGYIEEYKCMNSAHDDAKESRVSFPSGHSSFSAYTMLYIAIFVQIKWVTRKSTLRLVKSGFQLSLLLIAYYTALSRVMDNKHHWSDVSVGALIGAVSASLTVKYVSYFASKNGQLGQQSSADLSLGGVANNGRNSQHNYDVEAPRPPMEQLTSAQASRER